MLKQCEKAEITMASVSFILKFKKNQQGKPLTPSLANNVSNLMDVFSDKINEGIKVVRAAAAFALNRNACQSC